MRIGVLGTGNVGRVLGAGFIGVGHEVMMGSRTPDHEKLVEWKEKVGEKGSVGSYADAAAFGEMVVLATVWRGTESAIELAGKENFASKTVIDVTNPLVFSPDGPPTLALGHTDSGGEQVQRWLPDARVVKAFNTVGNPHMVNPDFPCGPPDMLICGNDAEAKRQVDELCTQLGWNGTVDIGGIDGSRELESFCILWVKFGRATGGWNNALKMLRK